MPHYSLSDVKKLVRAGKVDIRPNALRSAYGDFGWVPSDIQNCLLKLNGRPHSADRKRNHFYKTEDHRKIPHTKMDYYKAKKIMQNCNVYTHFYIHPSSGRLVISSFKEL